MAFHETRFPTDISFGARGGPRRRTVIATSGSGFESRNAQWADSRREYNAGYGIKDINDIHTVIEFFEERLGRLHGFRWKDKVDFKSGKPHSGITPTDQLIGIGNGSLTTFQLKKTYGSTINPYTRDIKKPVPGTTRIALDGLELTSGWRVNTNTGIVTLNSLGRSNSFLFSEQFDQSVWQKINATVTPNLAVAPDGTTTADRVVVLAGTNRGISYPFSNAFPAGRTYVVSFYVFSESTTELGIRLRSDGTLNQDPSDFTVTAIGGQWTRVHAIKTFSSGVDGNGLRVFLYGSPRDVLGPQKTFFLWGAQFEEANELGDYLRTTNLPLSSAQDSAPGNGVKVTAGFEFDVPVRFDTDFLDIDYSNFEAGSIPDIPIIEVRL